MAYDNVAMAVKNLDLNLYKTLVGHIALNTNKPQPKSTKKKPQSAKLSDFSSKHTIYAALKTSRPIVKMVLP